MKRSLFLLAGLAMLAALGRGPAQQPAADPYYVAETSGNWFICVASYSGADAAAKAYDFVQEIRTKYKSPAFVFNRGAEERAKRWAEIDKLREKCPEGRFRTIRTEDQYAVLVGGYKDNETARKELDRVKKWPFPDDRFCGLSGRIVPGKSDKGEDGYLVQQIKFTPFGTAFVVPNPLTPPERAPDNVADPFMKKLNANEDFSLLSRCKQPYTMTIAVFQSPPTLQGQTGSSSFLDKLTGRNQGEQLAAGAMTAHNLAEALRKLGFEAYVLHTRYNSVVSLGGYASKEDGRMAQVWEALDRQKMAPQIKALLLSRPLPMEVPKS